MTLTKTLASATVAVTLAAGAASAQETWQMTTTWPSSLDLIQFDKHFVDLANKLAGDEVTI